MSGFSWPIFTRIPAIPLFDPLAARLMAYSVSRGVLYSFRRRCFHPRGVVCVISWNGVLGGKHWASLLASHPGLGASYRTLESPILATGAVQISRFLPYTCIGKRDGSRCRRSCVMTPCSYGRCFKWLYCLLSISAFLFFCSRHPRRSTGKSSMILSQASRPALNSEVLFYRMGSVRAILLLIGRRIQRFV